MPAPRPEGTRVELWLEGDRAHIRVHSTGENFAAVQRDLIKLADRLDAEIADGPTGCPFSPLRRD